MRGIKFTVLDGHFAKITDFSPLTCHTKLRGSMRGSLPVCTEPEVKPLSSASVQGCINVD